MRGQHVAPVAHPALHLDERGYRVLLGTLWALATVALFILGVATSPASLPAGVGLVVLSMGTAVGALHAGHGGRFWPR